jgi:hypothetical protein
MSIDNCTEGRLGTTPKFMRGEARCLDGDLIVDLDGVTESEGPEIVLMMVFLIAFSATPLW